MVLGVKARGYVGESDGIGGAGAWSGVVVPGEGKLARG